MKSVIFLSFVVICGLVNAQSLLVKTEYQDVCSKQDSDSLQSRVSRSDVVLTATIVRTETENPGSEKPTDINTEPDPMKYSDERLSSRTVAYVKLWRVVKGSLAEVSNHTSGPQDLLSDEINLSHSGIESPILKLYGLWNDKLCGSHLSTGDTRVFFLKKFRDVRELNDEDNYEPPADDPLKVESMTLPGKLQNTSSDTMEDSTTESETTPSKPKKKRKKGKGPKKNKKGRKGKKKKKNKATTKSGKKSRKSKSKRKKRNKRKSDSVRGELEKMFKRPKRSAVMPNKVTRLSEREVKVRRQIDIDPRSVLVLHSSPARITLANLNSVEDLSKL
ncbi:uncharacterized protein LOC120330846 [Styela clava]|uniref:uncharacterized protein LOC120330846 n=1 Tax=Styela clava TaxID=7725 RepID=UPI0019396AA9|nr:uncharacterized protein LOC120330846 [Styela clava]